MSFFFCGDAPRCGALSMPRGSAPIIPRGSAFRICLWQIHGSRRRAGARVRGGIFGWLWSGFILMRDDGSRCWDLIVFGACHFGTACGFSIHLQSGFRPLLYMPFFLMRDKGKRCGDLIVSKRPGTYRLKAAIILAGDRRANNSLFMKSIAGATCSKNL